VDVERRRLQVEGPRPQEEQGRQKAHRELLFHESSIADDCGAGEAAWLRRAGRNQCSRNVDSFATGACETLTDFGLFPAFLPDNRRILFQALGTGRSRDPSHYEPDFKLYVVDRVTKAVREVLSRDGRTLALIRTVFEADLWLLDARTGDSEATFR
jgi:hypothetical protein